MYMQAIIHKNECKTYTSKKMLDPVRHMMISDIISQASLIDTDFKQYFISLGFIFSSSGIGIFSAVARLCNTAQAISRLLDVSNLVPIGCPRHAERLFRLPNARSIVALILACAVLYSFFLFGGDRISQQVFSTR